MTKSVMRLVAVRVACGAWWWAPRLVMLAFSSVLFVSMGSYGCGGDDDEFCNYDGVVPVLDDGTAFSCPPPPPPGTPEAPSVQCVDLGVDLVCGSQRCNSDTSACDLTQCVCVDDLCANVSIGLGFQIEGCPTPTPTPE